MKFGTTPTFTSLLESDDKMPSAPRRFFFKRKVDVSGTSGTGWVAEGVVFHDGTVALRWRTDTASTGLYGSMEELKKIHGHEGNTEIIFVPNDV